MFAQVFRSDCCWLNLKLNRIEMVSLKAVNRVLEEQEKNKPQPPPDLVVRNNHDNVASVQPKSPSEEAIHEIVKHVVANLPKAEEVPTTVQLPINYDEIVSKIVTQVREILSKREEVQNKVPPPINYDEIISKITKQVVDHTQASISENMFNKLSEISQQTKPKEADICSTTLDDVNAKTKFLDIFNEKVSILKKSDKNSVIEAFKLIFTLMKQNQVVDENLKIHQDLADEGLQLGKGYLSAIGELSDDKFADPLSKLHDGHRDYLVQYFALANKNPYIEIKIIKTIRTEISEIWQSKDLSKQIKEYCSSYCIHRIDELDENHQIILTGICGLYHVKSQNIFEES